MGTAVYTEKKTRGAELVKIKEAISLARSAYHHGMTSLHDFIEGYGNGADIKGYLVKIEKIIGDKNTHVATRIFGFDSGLEKEIEQNLVAGLSKRKIPSS